MIFTRPDTTSGQKDFITSSVKDFNLSFIAQPLRLKVFLVLFIPYLYISCNINIQLDTQAFFLFCNDLHIYFPDIQLPTQPLDIASLKNTATKMTTGNGSGLPETPSAVALPLGAMAAPSSGNTVSLLRGIRAKSSKESANNNFSNNNNNNFVSKVL